MNTLIKTLAIAATLVAGSFAGPRLDLTLDRHVNATRLTDENVGAGKDLAGVKVTMGDVSVKLDGLTPGAKFESPNLTVGYAYKVLGMDRVVASYDRHIIGLGLEKSVAVNSLADLNVGLGFLRDKDSGLKSLPQGTASLGLLVHVF